jgi:tyrosyl-tRNA synthetase
MSISDELMWRYYELLTDLRAEEIAALRAAAERGERNPRDIKVELAKRIITDFHSAEAARQAEEEFNSIFKRREVPDEIEERTVAATDWGLRALLVETGLASSNAEARRLIEQGGVSIDGQVVTMVNHVEPLRPGMTALLKVGKRRFLRVKGN